MGLKDLSDPRAVEGAMAEFDELGREAFLDKYGIGGARGWLLVEGGREYDAKAIAGAAHGHQFPDEGPLAAGDFHGGDTTAGVLRNLSFTVKEPSQGRDDDGAAEALAAERGRRRAMWAGLARAGGPRGLAPDVLRGLGVYGGAQGVWVDKARTGPLTPGGAGVAVGLLHTGSSYADDLADDAVVYHYPTTRRPAGRDAAEVAAVKAAGELGLPVFVVAYPRPGAATRDVALGWVAGHDDRARQFLVLFGERPPAPSPATAADEDAAPFTLAEAPGAVRPERPAPTRPGQQRFKFLVFRRYGPECAACGMALEAVLEAAHLRPKARAGSDDPRNGLVLCATHHRAFDAGLFAVEPGTLALRPRPGGPSLAELRVTRASLAGLARPPHREALAWRWSRWAAADGACPRPG